MKSTSFTCIITLGISVFLFSTNCSKSSKDTNTNSVTSVQALQDTIAAMSDEELSGTLEVLGISKAELLARIAAGNISPLQLQRALETIKSERALKVRLDFSSNQATYVPHDETESFMPCLNYDPASRMPGIDYVADKVLPVFNETPIVDIVPDEQGIPKEYLFKSKYADSGCGTRLLKGVCRLFNNSAWERKNAWIAERAKRKAAGEQVADEEYPVNYLFIDSSYFDCHVPNSNVSNNTQQIIFLFLNKAKVDDKISFSMWPVDGANNWGNGKSVEFLLLDKILNRVAPK